jgi:flagellar M-ring protein FliF
MDQIKKLFRTLSLSQKVVLALAIILMAAGVPAFTHWQHDRDFRPLFTNMAPEDAGLVVAKLKESGTEYRLADNGTTVLVAAEKVDESRLELAGAGLPKTGRIGFELFDKTNLGLTDFGEHVNYQRALEGELERTMKALDAVETAHVHISFPKDSVFLDAREPAKASVLVSIRPGAALTPQNVLAITNLMASAVAGLSPQFVSVVDMQGTLLNRPKQARSDGQDPADGILEYKHQVEKDLTAKVEATLEPLLGEGKFRVGVSADCDFSTTEQTEETFDPTRSVMATTQKTEDLSSSPGQLGVPGTPSNLPRSTIKPFAAGGSGAGVSRRSENTAFETSRSVRQMKTPRGTIKRVSTALLLDQEVQWQGKGAQRKRILIVPTPEKLKAIHDLVAGVIGFVPERDQLVVESLPFEQTRALEDAAAGKTAAVAKTAVKFYEDPRVLIGGGALLLVVLVLTFMLARKGKPEAAQLDGKPGLPEGKASGRADKSLPADAPASALPGTPATPLQLPVITSKAQQTLALIQASVRKDPVFASNIIRGWMEEQ